MSELKLRIGEFDFIGFESISVRRSIQVAVSDFALSMSLNDADAEGFDLIIPGAECSIRYGDDLLLSGYIDNVEESGDASSHNFSIVGRSKTQDLVDCSATITSQFNKQTLVQIATQLSEVYGIKVVVNGADKVIDNFQVQQGEGSFDAIQRLAEQEKLYITDTPSGNLLLTYLGNDVSPNRIVRNTEVNTGVLAYVITRSSERRYSKVIVRSQYDAKKAVTPAAVYVPPGGSSGVSGIVDDVVEAVVGPEPDPLEEEDGDFGEVANQVEAIAEDPGMTRERTKIIIADSSMNQEQAQNRADWEVQASRGSALQIQYTVMGWIGAGKNGVLWREGQLVEVVDEFLGIDDSFVLSDVEYSLDSNGMVAALYLAPPEAFQKEPVYNKPSKAATKVEPAAIYKPE